MQQIVLYVWLFVRIVVYAVDAISDWLTARGFSTGTVVLLIIGAFILNIHDKWSISIEERLRAIESKLGIERAPPVEKRSSWGKLLAWFIVAVYVLGKSLQAEGFTFAAGIVLSGFMLLLCALCAYSFIDQAVRDYWRKKRETQKFLDKISHKHGPD